MKRLMLAIAMETTSLAPSSTTRTTIAGQRFWYCVAPKFL